MAAMHWITSVEYLAGYQLRLGFNDGSIKVVDLANHLDGEVFEPLKDLRLFQTAKLNADLDTVVWDNGADMAPEFLFELGQPEDTALKVAETLGKYKAKQELKPPKPPSETKLM